jgi:hypothetical protein
MMINENKTGFEIITFAEAPQPVFAHVARNGAYIHQKITEEALHDLIKSSQVLPTDHVYHPISINWITIAEYRNQRGIAHHRADQPTVRGSKILLHHHHRPERQDHHVHQTDGG